MNGPMDQARTLRLLRAEQDNDNTESTTGGDHLVITVASGKGGVGKTNLVANLAVLLGQQGYRVLATDGDLGLANLDLAFGLTPKQTLMDVLRGDVDIGQVIQTASDNVALLPGCSGGYELANLSEIDRRELFHVIDELEAGFDALLIDAAAGIGSNAVGFAAAAQQVVLVTTPEPTAFADCYAFAKVLAARSGHTRVGLVVNMVNNPTEGDQVYERFSLLANRFLNLAVDHLGSITRDSNIPQSIRNGTPAVVAAPKAPSSQCVRGILKRLMGAPRDDNPGGIALFWQKLLGGGRA